MESCADRPAGLILLGSSSSPTSDSRPASSASSAASPLSWTDLPPHGDEDQVKLDVNRSFVYYPNGTPPWPLYPSPAR